MPEILQPVLQRKYSPASDTAEIGQTGESLAARFLLRSGYRIVLSNFKIPVGRNNRGATVTGEIDLIALDGKTLCFVEVKTRTSSDFASPLAAIDLRKQRQIIRAARAYRKVFRLGGAKFRYDAVSVIINEKAQPKIELFKNFWTEEKFRKKYWSGEF